MSAEIIDGKSFSKNLIEKVKNAVSGIMSKYNFKPGLAVVLVGENPASQIYVKNKIAQTKEVGIESY